MHHTILIPLPHQLYLQTELMAGQIGTNYLVDSVHTFSNCAGGQPFA